tara:strand:- start:275 stop:1210 length:936 start_codon:yes stop_codon:yes gene_type:complete
MREKDLKEDLATLAYKAEADHEVQMARSDLYKIAKYSIKLHEMMKGVTEQEGIEGWVQSKITKAADYIGSVYHYLDYEMKFDEMTEAKKAKPDYIDIDGDGDKKEPMKKAVKDKAKKKKVKEGMMDDEVKSILMKHPKEFAKLRASEDLMDVYGTPLYQELFEYFSDSGEMPYGTQKGRDGDPVQWMNDELDDMGVFDQPEKMNVSAADKRLNTPAFKKMQAGDKRYSDKTEETYESYLQEKLNKTRKYKTLLESVGKPISEEEFDTLAEKQDACYHKVKSRYKVWPSAYASGALVQCRKKGAKNWGNKSK